MVVGCGLQIGEAMDQSPIIVDGSEPMAHSLQAMKETGAKHCVLVRNGGNDSRMLETELSLNDFLSYMHLGNGNAAAVAA